MLVFQEWRVDVVQQEAGYVHLKVFDLVLVLAHHVTHRSSDREVTSPRPSGQVIPRSRGPLGPSRRDQVLTPR